MEKIGLPKLFTKVFSTESVENLFSSIRRKKKSPTALEVKYIIRSLIIIKFSKPSKYGSYDPDELEGSDGKTGWLKELKEIREKEKLENTMDEEYDYPIITADITLKDYSEEIALCNLIGCVFRRTILTKSKCARCEEELVRYEP